MLVQVVGVGGSLGSWPRHVLIGSANLEVMASLLVSSELCRQGPPTLAAARNAAGAAAASAASMFQPTSKRMVSASLPGWEGF